MSGLSKEVGAMEQLMQSTVDNSIIPSFIQLIFVKYLPYANPMLGPRNPVVSHKNKPLPCPHATRLGDCY